MCGTIETKGDSAVSPGAERGLLPADVGGAQWVEAATSASREAWPSVPLPSAWDEQPEHPPSQRAAGPRGYLPVAQEADRPTPCGGGGGGCNRRGVSLIVADARSMPGVVEPHTCQRGRRFCAWSEPACSAWRPACATRRSGWVILRRLCELPAELLFGQSCSGLYFAGAILDPQYCANLTR